jgi:hypothetical protein
MELRELTPEEDAVLLGFMREIITADGQYSGPERAQVLALESALGKDRVGRAMADAQQRFPTRTDLKEAAKLVTRVEARQTIFAFLEKVAKSDILTGEEDQPLKWLASWWDIVR